MTQDSGKRYSSAELTEMADHLVAFREKFDRLRRYMAPVDAGPLGRWYEHKNGTSPLDFEGLKAEVSTLAGAAQVGIVVTNSVIKTTTEDGRQITLNPVAAWLTITQPKALIEPDDVLHAARVAEGKLRADARTALREEKTLAGRVAAVIRWPSRVREIAGFERESVAGRATQWTLGGIMAGVFASLVAALVWALIGWLVT